MRADSSATNPSQEAQLMDFFQDPFMPAQPHDGSPVHIFDETMTEAVDQAGFDFLDATDTYFGTDLGPSNYTDSLSSKSNTVRPAPIELPSGHAYSPESSEVSSGRSKRNSLESLGSSSMDVDIANAQEVSNTPPEAGVSGNPSDGNDLFDFESAASSPSPYLQTKPPSSAAPRNAIKIPYRSSPNLGYRPYVGSSSVNRQEQTGFIGQAQYISGALLGEPSQPTWTSSAASPDGVSASNLSPNLHPSPSYLSYTPPTSTKALSQKPTIRINPLPAKSRVETQIPIVLSLDTLPKGVEKLHLQTHTMSKSKLMAKPPCQKSPDMLELHATLVCTSAMKDPAKKERAMARAAVVGPNELEDIEPRLPAAELPWVEDDEKRPRNGGAVHICKNCITRETKRTNRKKTKNAEEEELWRKDEKKRIIVFNTQEIQKWQQPSQSSVSNGKGQNKYLYGEDPSLSEGIMQVEIPMRIACYCRHQEEKTGFQVIFTIKDHKDNIIAQQMTESIIITDDHKTHTAPNPFSQTPVVPDNVHYAGAGGVQQAPGDLIYPNVLLAPDLQAVQHHFHYQNSHETLSFATPQQNSHIPPTCMTSQNGHYQVSPSAPSGPQSKKRKGSTAAARMMDDLAMTKLEESPSAMRFSSVASPIPPALAGAPGYSPNYPVTHGLPMAQIQPMSSQFNTSPPTPANANSTGTFNPAAHTSQSMENLQNTQGIFSAPTSARHSRIPSPTAAPQSSMMSQPNLQTNTNSLTTPGLSTRLPMPVIDKITPGSCSKSGGIEVSCLGSGFYPGLEVMFGEHQATSTQYWAEQALLCRVPPAVKAGKVPITFKYTPHQSFPSPPRKPVQFQYVDDEDQELLKQALALINRQFHIVPGAPDDIGQKIVNFYHNMSNFRGGTGGNDMPNQGSTYDADAPGDFDVQTAVVQCLEMVDMDERPYQASLNFQGPSGQSMLHLSASLGYYRLAAALLVRGADPDLRDKNGMTPMHFATLHGHLQVVKKLLSAGADPTVRSLNGLRPGHMTNSTQLLDYYNSLDHESSYRSVATSPVSQRSRASSVRSLRSVPSIPRMAHSRRHNTGTLVNDGSDDEGPLSPPMILRGASGRSSLASPEAGSDSAPKDNFTSDPSLFASNLALSAWVDQALAQIQQLQQSVHRALPLIPNLPDYQAYPVVRRISSLVPQRSSRPGTADGRATKLKEAEYHWWELLTGTASSPPAYEDIYPEISQLEKNDEEASVLRAAGEALLDQKCEAVFDQAGSSSDMETVNIAGLTKQQEERLRSAHARKVKKLRSDRKLFFIWIPLLILVILAMLRDRAPQIWTAARHVYSFVGNPFQNEDRVVETV